MLQSKKCPTAANVNSGMNLIVTLERYLRNNTLRAEHDCQRQTFAVCDTGDEKSTFRSTKDRSNGATRISFTV
jgi:hypothetical protein